MERNWWCNRKLEGHGESEHGIYISWETDRERDYCSIAPGRADTCILWDTKELKSICRVRTFHGNATERGARGGLCITHCFRHRTSSKSCKTIAPLFYKGIEALKAVGRGESLFTLVGLQTNLHTYPSRGNTLRNLSKQKNKAKQKPNIPN